MTLGAWITMLFHKLLMLIAYSADRVTAGLARTTCHISPLDVGIAGDEFVWIRVETKPLSARSR